MSFKSVLKLVDGLFTSKLRYGIQLLGKVRTTSEDPECAAFKSLQLVQNNLLRSLNGSKIKDMVSIESMLDKFRMLSANQLNASVKLLEVWKAINIDDYPLTLNRQEIKTDGVTTRADSTGKPIKMGKSAVTQRSSVSDGIHIWNNSPKNVTESKSISQAKKEIRAFAKLLPV